MTAVLQSAAPATAVVEGADGRAWSRAELQQEVQNLADTLVAGATRVLATLMDNAPAWVVADLAASQARLVHVPLPLFFTPQQLQHALGAAGVDTVLAAPAAAAAWPQLPQTPCCVAGEPLVLLRLPAAQVAMPAGTAKVTFTSGTTGAPKGVCLRQDGLDAVARGLVEAMEPLGIRRHLCALPLAVLLENVAGVLAPLASGATCLVLPLREVGLSGSSGFEPAVFQAALVRHQPDSVILLPQMLRAWTFHLAQSGQRAPACLRMAAVGGAPVGVRLLAQARALGIPAYEGYGLSEGASVQTLNLPQADRPGSAGRPLPHARVRIAADGEVEIAGTPMAGYLGDPAPVDGWWPTGDLGRIDADGYLHVRGRRKHVLITGFGRNVSPEWVESALRDQPSVGQAVVFGEGQAALSAVLWPLTPQASDADLQAAVDAANAGLPDYARIGRWVRGRATFDAASGLATANGRPQRSAILQLHAASLGLHAPARPEGNS